MSVLGTAGAPSWAQALVSPRMSLNKFLSPYAILKNLIIRSRYDASARPCSHCYAGTVIRHKFVPAQLCRHIGVRSH